MLARSFFAEFDRLFPQVNRTWLLLGKGPSFGKYEKSLSADKYTLGLNHVGASTAVDLTHVIDMEVIQQCGPTLLENSKFLVMPWIPHVRHRRSVLTPGLMMDASGISLEEWTETDATLRAFAREGRLLWYNLSTAPERMLRREDPRVVPAAYFSASTAVHLLAQAGRRVLRTLGIDGGTQYAGHFSRLAGLTLFANGRNTFDLQFQDISRAIREYNLDFGPMDVETPIRVFVGAEPEQELAVKVLEYSIRKHASMSVVVQPLYAALAAEGMDMPLPQSPALAPRTPFSYQRFAIPALKKYVGRAIYLDSDMLVFDDIKKLWTIPFEGASLLAVQEPPGSGRLPQFSVSLMDCEALAWDVRELVKELDAGRWTYEQFMFEMSAAPSAKATIPSRWNDLERYRQGETALTHFTDMDQQPWLETVNPLAYVWCRELLEAIEKGVISRSFVEGEVGVGNVRPSLLAQIDMGIADPLALPRSVRRLDRDFLPPHVRSSGKGKNVALLRLRRKLRMHLWRLVTHTGLSNLLKNARARAKSIRKNERIANARRERGMRPV
jgi:hypothetical protein